jgi:hypothetical protein
MHHNLERKIIKNVSASTSMLMNELPMKFILNLIYIFRQGPDEPALPPPPMKIPRMHMPPMPGMMMPMPGMGMPPGMSHHQFPGMQQFVPASMPYPGFLIRLCDNEMIGIVDVERGTTCYLY